ncbi:MAG TPA: N-acetyltransferase [Jatrophihabitans sp.]|nr:N-acetyltransferase [Jatrophihabitans sp.]
MGDGRTTDPVVRPYRAADDQPVRHLLTEAFGDAAVADLAGELRGSDAHRAALVAELDTAVTELDTAVTGLDTAVTGLVQLSRGWLDAPARLVEVLVLSPLGVLPELQRRGIGTALVRAAVDTARELGFPLLFLEGSPRYYSRHGFSPAARHGFLRPSQRIPEPAFQVTVLPGWQDWMVGALVYPDVFWRYDMVGLRGERLARVIAESG